MNAAAMQVIRSSLDALNVSTTQIVVLVVLIQFIAIVKLIKLMLRIGAVHEKIRF